MDRYFSGTIHHEATVKQAVVKGELKYVAAVEAFVDPKVGVQVFGDVLMVLMIVIVITGNYAVHYWEDVLLGTKDEVHWIWPKAAALFVSIQILTIDHVWSVISKWIVDREHHTSAAEWNNSWVRKMFPVRITNNIYPFFFVGLLKQYTKGGCDSEGGCIAELEVELYVFFAVRFFKQIAQDLILFLITKVQVMNEMSKVSHEKHYTFLEVQAKSLQFDDHIRLNDWSEQIMAFVFVSCFNVVLPAVAPIALLTSMLRQRCFLHRNLCFLRRPVPVASTGIGPWQTVFETTEVLAVVLNLSFAVFAMKPIMDLPTAYKWAIFVGAQYAIFLVKLLVRGKYPVPPRRVEALSVAADETIRKVFLNYELHKVVAQRVADVPHVGPRALAHVHGR
jgi:hypothetical protein